MLSKRSLFKKAQPSIDTHTHLMARDVMSPVDELGHGEVGHVRRVFLDDLLESCEISSVVNEPSAKTRSQAALDAERVFFVLERQVSADWPTWFGRESSAANRSLYR